MLGLSQAAAARAAGVSRSRLGRLERDESLITEFEMLYRAARILGLRPAIRLYPAGSPVRDRAHLALLSRLEGVLGSGLVLSREVPLPIAGDLRAWDAWIRGARRNLAVEAETHVRDIQDLQRRVALKLRDDPRVDAVLVVLARTEHHRRLLRTHRHVLVDVAPEDSGPTIRLLRHGELPTRGGLVLL